MTYEARQLIKWFYEKYPLGVGTGKAFEMDVRRAQEDLLELRNTRRARSLWKGNASHLNGLMRNAS